MKEPTKPAWWDDARWYYSRIGEESAQPVRVFDATGQVEVSDDSPGKLRVQLEPRSRYSPRLRVLDAVGKEKGSIRPEGLVPGVNYAMRQDDELVWMLTVRSIVRKHHALERANGDSWRIDTPFFWWQQLTGTASGEPRLFGGYLRIRTLWIWEMYIEPGWDTFDLLAAVAFLHRQWFHC